MSYKCHKRYQNTRMLSDSITVHQFTSCKSTDSDTKINRHRLLHSSEEGSGSLKKRKDKITKINRKDQKERLALSVTRALSSHLSATRPVFPTVEKKKIFRLSRFIKRKGVESPGCCRSAISRGTDARESRWAGSRIEHGIAGKRTRLVQRCGPACDDKATQGDATRRDREWERKRRRCGEFSSRVVPRSSRGAPSSQVKRSLRRTDSVVAARSRLDDIYLPARGDPGRSVYRPHASRTVPPRAPLGSGSAGPARTVRTHATRRYVYEVGEPAGYFSFLGNKTLVTGHTLDETRLGDPSSSERAKRSCRKILWFTDIRI